MDEPIYSESTERIYAGLPEFYRIADQQYNYTLKRWLSGISDRLGEIDVLFDRIDYIDPSERVGAVASPTTGEHLLVEASSIAQIGAWTSTINGVKSNDVDGVLSHEFYLKGGTYNLALSYMVGPDRGIAQIVIDGTTTIFIDQYAPAGPTTQSFPLNNVTLDQGYHAITFACTGTKNAASSDTWVEADIFSGYNVQASPIAEDTSDLVDPDTADNDWLDWLGQLVGVQKMDPALTLTERRDAVRYAASGWRAGTKTAVANAAKSVLTGTQYAKVYDHATSISNAGTASAWDVLVVTRTSETPSVDTVLTTINRKNAKPAGVVLHHEAYEATWDLLESHYASWDAIEAVGSWDALQETMP